MKLPDNVNAQLAACINAVLPDIEKTPDPQTALVPLAMEILHREFGAFVLFCRFGDRYPDMSSRSFGIIEDGVATGREEPLDPRLAKLVRAWLQEHGG